MPASSASGLGFRRFQRPVRTVGLLAVRTATAMVCAAIAVRPFGLPGAGLDPSWQWVLEWGFRRGLLFGQELVFSFGPLGFLYANLFHPQTFVHGLVFQALLVVALAGWFLSARAPAAGLLAAALLLASQFVAYEQIFLVLPWIAVLLQWRSPGWPALGAWILIGALASIKFNYLILGLGLAICSAPLGLPRLPRVLQPLLGWVVGFGLAMGACGQTMGSSLAYLRNGWEISAGYSAAMGLYQFAWHAPLFLLAAAITAPALLAALGRSRPGLRQWLPLVLPMGLFVFVLFKNAFVREVGHSMVGWAGLCAMTAATMPLVRSRGHLAVLTIAAVLALLAGGIVRSGASVEKAWSRLDRWTAEIRGRIRFAGDVLVTEGYLARLASAREAREAKLAERLRLPAGGTIDAVPWELSPLLAGDHDYRPRPLFQSYAALTERLASMNLRHLREAAPDRLLLSARAIDHRWPTADGGFLYPEILRRYDVAEIVDDQVLLERLQRSRSWSVRDRSEALLDAERWHPVPEHGDGMLFLRLDFVPTPWNRLQNLLFKGPVLELEARLSDGSAVRHRIVPAVSGLGFFLSPYLKGAGVATLWQPLEAAAWRARRVVEVRVTGQALAWASFEPRVRAVFEVYPEVGSYRAGERPLRDRLAASARHPHSHLPEPFGEEGLSTHAPMTLGLRVENLVHLEFTFGIQDGAWKRGRTNGAALTVDLQAEDGSRRRLFQRALDPLAREGDRGPQRVEMTLPAPASGTLEFVFDDLGDRSWDWTYLQALRLESQQVANRDADPGSG